MPENYFTIRDGLRIAMRYRRIFFICAAIFCIISLQVMQRVMVKQYTSAARFERRLDTVELGGEKSIDSFASLKKTLPEDIKADNAIEQLINDLETDGLIDPLPRSVDGIGLTVKGRRERQRLLKQIKSSVKVKFQVRSDNVDYVIVSCTQSSPKLAAKIPNELIKIYINNTSENVRMRLERKYAYLSERYDKAREVFKLFQAQRDDFEAKYAGITVGSPLVILQQIQESKAHLAGLENQLVIAKKNLKKIMALREKQKSGTAEPSQIIYGPNPELARLDKELTEYREQLEKAVTLEHMTEEHPAVKALRSSINLVEERIKRTPPEIKMQTIYSSGAGMQSFVAMAADKQAEVESVENQLQFARAKVDGFEKMQQGFVRAKKDYTQILELWKAARSDFRYWEKQMKDAESRLADEVANRRTTMSTRSMAKIPLDPSAPSLKMVFGFAFVGAIGFGGAIVFLLYKASRTISTPEEAVRQFELPVFGVISEIVTPVVKHRRRFSRIFIDPAIAAVLLVLIGVSSYSANLWMNDPELYKQFNADPINFMTEKVESAIEGKL